MSSLAALIAEVGFLPDTPVALATVDASGRLDSAVSGVWSSGRPVSPADRFYAASLAKQVTGAAAALLVRKARLDPDAPIAHHLDGLPPWGSVITARQMAHHLAGLPEAGVAEAVIEGDWTDSAVSDYLARLPVLPHAPGEGFRYSNLGYVLLAHLVAAIAGLPLADVVARTLVEGDDIGFTSEIGACSQAAHLGDRLPLTQGDGGLWTTAPAFARWLDRQNRDPLGLAAIVTAPGRLADGHPVPYGWGVGLRSFRGHPLYIHGGEWPGATAKSMRCPELGLSVVVLAAGGSMPSVLALADAAFEQLTADH